MNSELLSNIIASVVFFLMILLFAVIALQKGIITTLRDATDFTRNSMERIVHEPAKPEPLPDLTAVRSCKILHETAALEIEIYGQIVSGSIEQHMKNCGIDFKNINYDPPTSPNNCLHEYDVIDREIGGAVYLGCDFCGKTKRLTHLQYLHWERTGTFYNPVTGAESTTEGR